MIICGNSCADGSVGPAETTASQVTVSCDEDTEADCSGYTTLPAMEPILSFEDEDVALLFRHATPGHLSSEGTEMESTIAKQPCLAETFGGITIEYGDAMAWFGSPYLNARQNLIQITS